MCKRLGFIHYGDRTDKNFGPGRYFDTGHFSNFHRRLTDNFRIQSAVEQNDVLNGFQLFAFQNITAVGFKTFFDLLIHIIHYDNRLLRGTNHAVIEGF